MAFVFQELDALHSPSAESGRAHFGAWAPEECAEHVQKDIVLTPLASIEKKLGEAEKTMSRLPQIRRLQAKDLHVFLRSWDCLEDWGSSRETGRREVTQAARFPGKSLRMLGETLSVQGQASEESVGSPHFTKQPVPPPGRPQASQRLRSIRAMRVATRSPVSTANVKSLRTTAASEVLPEGVPLFEDATL